MERKVLIPRPYQLDLVEYATQRNCIIYLPTGSGKTFIAIMALKRFSSDFEKPIGEGGKRAIFMCNTVELARQQTVEIRNTNFKTGFYVGERGIDNWSKERWLQEIRENQVLVGTAQIFVDIVTQNYISINDLSIVIIDECHHGTKNHPMHEFMRLFMLSDPNRLPRVVGLTGVLLKGNKSKAIVSELENLEATFRGNIISVSSAKEFDNVMVYSTNPKEEIVFFEAQKNEQIVVRLIHDMIQSSCVSIANWPIGTLQTKLTKSLAQMREPNKKTYMKNLLKDFLHQMDDFGLYAASIAIMSPIIDFEIKRRQSPTIAMRNLYYYAITLCDQIRHMITKQFDYNTPSDVNTIMRFSSPKIRSLLLYIKKCFSGKNPADISCLIFVERRYSAKCLYYVIQSYCSLIPELKDIIKPQFMIGRNNIIASIESTLDRKWNKRSLDSFRSGDCNMIICSNVLEEGIDVQACNYVIAYDPLKTFSSYVQTKGRARSVDSHYIVFAPENEKTAVLQQIVRYRETHETIKAYLSNRMLDRSDPNEDRIAEQFFDEIPPFKLPNGACLLASSALQLLNRYCQMLPTDAFSEMVPWFAKLPQSTATEILVSLHLPLQSTVKETIISNPMSTVRMAKISAAFKTCVKLYENGELNENLLPITKRECVAQVAEIFFRHWQRHNDDVTQKTAGKQRRRLYDHLPPEELNGAMPIVGVKCYAYEITMKPSFYENDYNTHIFHQIQTQSNYAIFLNGELPKLAEMPVFMDQGQINVKINSKPIIITLTDAKQLTLLKKYHQMLWRDLLQLWKEFFVMDNRNIINSYLIVPLNKRKIDWEIVERFQQLPKQRRYTVNDREQQILKPENYLNKVVNKWYSNNETERFIVTHVRTDLNPKSQFENSSFSTFEEFMLSKYGARINNKIVHSNQFLLEVRQLTSRRNFFINAKGKATSVIKKKSSILLLPEFVHNFEYPSDLWIKALFLPSILHRLHLLLHAENIRKRINNFLGIKMYDREPKPLTIDQSLNRAVDSDGNAAEYYMEQRVNLHSLPTKSLEMAKDDIPILQDNFWKAYLEPTDLTRRTNQLYPIELDYYHKFISGNVCKISDVSIDDEDGWARSQLEMPDMSQKNNTFKRCKFDDDDDDDDDDDGVRNAKYTKNIKYLTDTPFEIKSRINILYINNNPEQPCSDGEQSDFVAALTTAAASDIFDMERFELLGDSFLKFSVSLFLANKFPKWHEGFLTEVKSKIVSNRNLLYCMLDTDITARIYSSLFKPNSEWLPPSIAIPANILQLFDKNDKALSRISPRDLYGLQLSEAEVETGICNEANLKPFRAYLIDENFSDTNTAHLGNEMNSFMYKEVMADKIVADTLEAILGVCVKSYGIHRSFRILEFFNICHLDDGENWQTMLNMSLCGPLLRTKIPSHEVDSFLINYRQLERNLGYTFKDRAYLLQALTHPSYPTNRLTGCYQELEFIGDAILDFLISCHIFERCQNMTPGMLTDLRSALVNNITLGCVCIRHRFHLFLLAENSQLSESIRTFADFQETQGHRVTDQVRILMEEPAFNLKKGGEVNEKDKVAAFNISTNVDVPKALGDIVEALIAAVYLDCRDLLTTWNVIYRLLEPELSEFSNNVPIDPVRQLYEHKFANPQFYEPEVDNEVCMIKLSFTCLNCQMEVNGFGLNSKQAKKSAAKHALQFLSRHSN